MNPNVTYLDYRPGALVLDPATVRPGTRTEFLRLAIGQVVTSFPGVDPAIEPDAPGPDGQRKFRIVPPGQRCQHCGKPSFAYDQKGRIFLWDAGDDRGCHCPPHPVGDGSDGGPVRLATHEERIMLAAERQADSLDRLGALVEALLKGMGAEVPAAATAKGAGAGTAGTAPPQPASRKTA